MTRHTVTLTLPETEPIRIGWVEADTEEALVATLRTRYPLLPPHHTLIGSRLLADLFPAETPVQELTAGQRVWRERKKARHHAERWRQHWIDKDNAKRQA